MNRSSRPVPPGDDAVTGQAGEGPSGERTAWRVVAFGISLDCLVAFQQFKLPPVLPVLLAEFGWDKWGPSPAWPVSGSTSLLAVAAPISLDANCANQDLPVLPETGLRSVPERSSISLTLPGRSKGSGAASPGRLGRPIEEKYWSRPEGM